jgi:hypothetical protein
LQAIGTPLTQAKSQVGAMTTTPGARVDISSWPLIL